MYMYENEGCRMSGKQQKSANQVGFALFPCIVNC